MEPQRTGTELFDPAYATVDVTESRRCDHCHSIVQKQPKPPLTLQDLLERTWILSDSRNTGKLWKAYVAQEEITRYSCWEHNLPPTSAIRVLSYSNSQFRFAVGRAYLSSQDGHDHKYAENKARSRLLQFLESFADTTVLLADNWAYSLKAVNDLEEFAGLSYAVRQLIKSYRTRLHLPVADKVYDWFPATQVPYVNCANGKPKPLFLVGDSTVLNNTEKAFVEKCIRPRFEALVK